MVSHGRCPAHTGGHALSAFFLAFGVVFLAEPGDKSQLMALALAARYRAVTVLVAVSLATLLVHAGSVLLGSVFALALPTNVIQIVAGLAFFGFAAWTIRGDSLGEGDESRTQRTGGWAILTIGTAFFLAELGDRRCSRRSRWPRQKSRGAPGLARPRAWWPRT
jgi:Ca2+/H+ antiporter, TMEM165/GDT1 family